MSWPEYDPWEVAARAGLLLAWLVVVAVLWLLRWAGLLG